MPILVAPDIVHPAAEAWAERLADSPYYTAGQTRVFQVTGLDDGTANAPASMLARALTVYGIPAVGSLATSAAALYGAIALRYRTEVIPKSDNTVNVIVEYRSPVPRSKDGGAVMYIVNDDAALTQETTQLHPSDKSQMTNTWTETNPDGSLNTANTFGPLPVTLPYSRPLRKITISGYVVDKDLDTARDTVGKVNDKQWFGKPIGYWRCEAVRTEGTLLGNTFKVSVDFLTRNNEDWRNWDVIRSDLFGERLTVNPKNTAAALAEPYQFYWKSYNGFLWAGLYPIEDFKTVFALSGYGDAQQDK